MNNQEILDYLKECMLGYMSDQHTSSRLQDAHAYCQKYLSAESLGRNVWHVILDDAIRMRNIQDDPQPE